MWSLGEWAKGGCSEPRDQHVESTEVNVGGGAGEQWAERGRDGI